MPTIGRASLPVPAGGDAPTIPSHLADLAGALDPHLVQHVADQAERDSEWADAPVRTLVIAADGSTWVKTSAASTWATVWEPLPAWQAITPAAGMELGSPPAQGRRIGNQVFLRGRVQATGDGAVIPTTNAFLGTVPSSWIPQVQVGAIAATCSLAGDVAVGVGKLEVLDAGGTSPVPGAGPGALLWFSQDGSGTPWVNISGSYWVD